MKVRDIMSATVRSVEATDGLGYAAREMADHDIGMLPVLDEAKLVGVITDRDIAVRAVAAGIPANAPVRQIMSGNVSACSPDDDIELVLETMGDEQIRRMPVCNQVGEVIGILALADIAPHAINEEEVSETLCRICEPSGVHSQAPAFARLAVGLSETLRSKLPGRPLASHISRIIS